MSTDKHTRPRLPELWYHARHPILFVLILIASLLVYWAVLNQSHLQMRQEARAHTQQLANQTAHSLSLHFHTTATKLDYFTQHLGLMWLHNDTDGFDDAVEITLSSLPAGGLTQVSVADVRGSIQYSRLADTPAAQRPSPPVSILDREHFQVHAQADHSFLHISEPVKGRISQQWTIQFTRGIWDDGSFAGVIVLSVSAEHLATALKEIFPDDADAGSLINSAGNYLARSHHLADVLGTTLPQSRPFILHHDLNNGSYEAIADVDHINRLYSWHRVTDFPLIVIVGQGSEKALTLTNEAIKDSHWQSGFGSSLLLLGGLMLAWLWTRTSWQASLARQVGERLELAVLGGNLGIWDYRLHDARLTVNDFFHTILGYDRSTDLETMSAWETLVHPDDRERFMADFRNCVAIHTDKWTGEYRVLGHDNRLIHVAVHGRVAEFDHQGKALRTAGTIQDVSTKVATAKLRDALLNRSAAAILLITPKRRVIEANAQFSKIFMPPGKCATQLKTEDVHIDKLHYEKFAEHYKTLREHESVRTEHPFKDADGNIRWFDVHGVRQDPDDPQSNIIWTWVDITSRHHAMTALSIETSRLIALLQNFPGGVLIEDAQDNVAFINHRWPKLLGLTQTAAQLQGLSDAELRSHLGPTMSGWLRTTQPGDSREARHLHEVITEHGRYLEIEHVTLQQNGDYMGSLWLVHDITDRKEHELDLARLASTDMLTGLPNRRSFMQSLRLHCEQATRQQQNPGVVMMLDIDRFKRVNDTYGHSVGDIVLQHIGHIMRETVRANDTPGRLGGEEFAVLLQRGDQAQGIEVAERIRKRVEDAVIEADGHYIRITISIGVAVLSAGVSPETTLKHADDALYHAKQTGRNRVCLFDELTATH